MSFKSGALCRNIVRQLLGVHPRSLRCLVPRNNSMRTNLTVSFNKNIQDKEEAFAGLGNYGERIAHQRTVTFSSSLGDVQSDENHSNSSNQKHERRSSNNRLMNAANIMEMLERKIPKLLIEPLSPEELSDHVILRICPHSYPLLPIVKNKRAYITVLKALRVVLTNFVLNPKIKLHVTSIHMEEPSVKIEEDQLREDNVELQEKLEKELIDKIPLFHEYATKSHKYSLFPWTYKIIVKWITCPENCDHLRRSEQDPVSDDEGSGSPSVNFTSARKYPGTTEARLGNYTISEVNETVYKDLNFNRINESLSKILVKKPFSGSDSRSEINLERVISGIFIFELNLNNDKILVHNVEDVEIIERKAEEPDLENLVGAT